MRDLQKYEDMAYGNPRGRIWLRELHTPEVWELWKRTAMDGLRNMCPIEEAGKSQWHVRKPNGYTNNEIIENWLDAIVTDSIWHIGYAHDWHTTHAMARTARRLRRPPDRGAGARSGDPGQLRADPISKYTVQVLVRSEWGGVRELEVFDNFLEYKVRPRLIQRLGDAWQYRA